MFGAFTSFGKLGSLARAIAAAWTPAALWPTGTEPGMWIDPSNLATSWQDSAGTAPVSTPGTVADSSNPVGLALDLRLGATTLTDPGNHLLQATSTARPLVSARVNLLTYTEDFGNAVWATRYANVTRGANLLTPTTDNGSHFVGNQTIATAAGAEYGFRVKAKSSGYNYIGLLFYDLTTAKQTSKTFNVSTGAVATQVEPDDGITSIAAITGPDVDGYYECSILTSAVPGGTAIFDIRLYNNTPSSIYAGDGTSAVNATDIQVSFGTQAYQAILTDGSTYPSTGFPVYQHLDGTDDGMATASFAAGTLSNAMDCMIAVRRDSGANCVVGLYQGLGVVFGEISGAAAISNEAAGTPTVWVDGVQVPGGTSVYQTAMNDAVTVGDWHIVEWRGLNLSAWTRAGFGGFGYGYNFNGARGDIMLFPSPADATERDKARQYLADKYGVTLP